MAREARQLVFVWAALLLLLALTVAAALGPFGEMKPALNLGVATAKAGLIAWFFMHLREQRGLHRIAALAALVWLSVLLVLTLVDRATRGDLRV